MAEETKKVEIKKHHYASYHEPIKKHVQDLSNEEEQNYIEIEPFAIDEETGEILNKSNRPIFKATDKTNIYEYIQSFKDECDIYKILESVNGDTEKLKRAPVFIGDLYDIPQNANDFLELMKKADPKVIDSIKDGNLNEYISNLVKEQIAKYNQVEEPQKGDNENESK